MACDSIDDMRAWRQGLAAEGAFGAPELGFAIRVLITKEGLAPQERAAYLRELLAAAAEGQVALDGKAAAYLLWGPAKLELPAADPDVQRVLPLACQHLDSMQVRGLPRVEQTLCLPANCSMAERCS